MNRSMKLSALVALALASSQALALDLGQIQVKSALDQPLVAEIPLQPEHSGEADHVTVSLASADAFARAGVDRADLKVPLSFKVVSHDGRQFIRVTSEQPVREPYLDFLIKVSWPQGKLLREYTVLLDPLSRGAQATPPSGATSGTAAPQAQAQAAAPSAASSTQSATPASPQREKPRFADTYAVRKGDNLSTIVRTHAVQGVSYQQMLVAFKATNPDAFYEDNVNALKAGAVLRIPTREQARAVTRAAAIAAVRRQNESWQAQRNSNPTMVAGTGGTSAPVAAGGGDAGGEHLALVPPQAESSSGDSSTGSGGTASASRLRQQLTRSEEALSSQKQSAADLKSRVAKLEKLQKKNERLLSLKDSEIAELQDKLADARKAAGLPVRSATAARSDLANATSAGAGELAASARSVPGAAAGTANLAAAHPGDSATVAAVAPARDGTRAAAPVPGAVAPDVDGKAPDAKPRATPPVPASTSPAAPWYEQLWARIVLAAIILLLILWAVLRRRKPAPQPAHSSLADQFDDTPFAARDRAHPAAPDDTATAEPDAEADPAGEHALLAQLAEHPDDVGLHLELASLYYARGDAEQFEAAAEAMHAYVDDETQPEWQEVVAMGRELVPDHPLFVAAAEQADHSERVQDGSESPADAVTDEPGDAATPIPAVDEEEGVPGAEEGFTFTDEPESAEDVSTAPQAAEPQWRGADTGGLPDESEFDALPPLPDRVGNTIVPDPEESVPEEPVLDEPVPEEPVPEEPVPEEPVPEEPVPLKDPEALSEDNAGAADDSAIEHELGEFSDDPVDTKLDLARAYIDMGDTEGARAMLREAVNEGSQLQKETAQKLLEDLD